MNHTSLKLFENLPYFTLEAFRQISGDAQNGYPARIALYRWAKAGRIIQLKKGFYMHRSFYEQHRGDPQFSSLVSAILLPQSYLSLEYVLQQHNILTEVTYPVTAVTFKNTRCIENSLGVFAYRHIRRDLYYGFQFMDAYEVPYTQASLAKALFDYLYLRPLPNKSGKQRYNLVEELRLNLDDFPTAAQAEFASYVAASNSPKMQRIEKNLEQHTWQP